jgi:membrane fusion protein (multidrug efflux system)
MASENPKSTAIKSGPLFLTGWIVAVVIVLIALGGLVLARDVWMTRQTSALEKEEQQGPLVIVVPLEHIAKDRSISLPGHVHGYFESPIYAKVSGYVKTLLVDKGARVKTGDLLAVIDAPELDHQVNDARATYEINAITDRRYQDLVRSQVIPQQTADQSHAAMLSSRAAWQSLKAQQAYERVIAPYDGVITQRNVDPGALVAMATAQATSTQPLLEMATLKPVRVYLDMAQDDAAFVSDGNPAIVTITQFPRKQFAGTVTRHPAALASQTRTMLVEVDLPNDDLLLLPGMYAHVKISIQGASAAPLVPDEALIFNGDKIFVPIVNANRVHLEPVTLGYDDGIRSQIVEGLKGNETVALNLGQTAREGEIVRPIQAPQK